MFGGSQVAVIRHIPIFNSTAAVQPPYENLVPYFPLSYAAAAAQPPNLNKVATKEGPSGKWPPVDTGENTVLLKMCVSLGQNDQDGSMMTVTFKV